MYSKLINFSRRKFNKILSFNLITLLSINLSFYKKDFLNFKTKKKQKLKWILVKMIYDFK